MLFSAFRRALVLILCFTALAAAAPPKKKPGMPRRGPVDWSDEVRFDFQEMPLREAFRLFAESEGFAFFLDRRVDTEIPVTCSVDPAPLLPAMIELAESAGLEAAAFGKSLLYVGPKGSAGELLLLASAHRGELASLETGYTPEKREGVIVPGELLKETAAAAGVQWTGLGLMPFDCWRADGLAPLSYRELYTLVLIGYGVDYQVEGDEAKPKLKPVKIDREKIVTRQWPEGEMPEIGPDRAEEITRTPIRGEVRVSGPFGVMAGLEYQASKNRAKRMAASPRPERDRQDDDFPGGAERFVSGEVRQVTLASLSETLKKELGIELRLDPSLDAMGITFETRVSCKFSRSDAADAVKIIANRLGVDFRFQGKNAILLKK
ncbi:MAG: hypothetical protein IJG60_00405 [Thermoguttaceae bacterium]|nr:hypothetical protein [Thermoguttaceae bacterium]